MNELDKLRADIDKIDSELVALFEKRMETVIKIGEYKRKNNIPIFNQSREIEVLKKNVSRLNNSEFENETKEFLNKAMEISREVQRKNIISMTDDGYLAHKNISKDYHSCGLDHELKVGYQGEPGAFSQEALTQYFGNCVETLNVREFEDVFKALKNDDIDYGVLPIENSSTGGIAEVYDLLKKYGFYIVGEKCIKVQHNLVASKDTEIEDIDEVYSHPQAFKQCSEFFKDYPDLRLIPFKNTATSAKYINEEKAKNKAAICSHKAALLYDLKIIKEDINYNTKNYTRFIMIGKDLEVHEISNKISIVTTTAHTPGSLYRTLGYFTENNLNMMKIESRPLLDRSWEYFFHIDFSGNLNDDAVKRSIEAIRKNSTYFKLLGNYVGHRI